MKWRERLPSQPNDPTSGGSEVLPPILSGYSQSAAMVIPNRLPIEARQSGSALRGRGVSAILGPTNTGKTHYAIERMLGHESGMIGLPLRLLAREVYQRVVARVGAGAVALITGEEKIKPERPRFWISTVEAMPRDLDVSFVAIDEIQLIADPDRGHVFTDAMLHRRGRSETLLLGAATARPIIEQLLPGVHVQIRPRLSTLSFAGDRKITRLPPRSAIIAFSAEEVYGIAELVRRHRGGAAVVMGSLSPRTRNAQVEMFQAGEVEHIVATDAIGMGLNLEIAHVAFGADQKFDGQRFRLLLPTEIAQIAGRAGRAQQDGTFGGTGRCPPFDEKLIDSLENHVFDPLISAQWRNSALDFSSLGKLEASLLRAPNASELIRARRAEDEITLEIATSRPLIRDLAVGSDAVRRLWDVCQLPDYRKVSPHMHADLVLSLFEPIMRKGSIDIDWFSREIAACDRVDGDIDALSWRLAQVRTWSYCANRPDWIRNPEHWQNVARTLEDRLSDALHERLMHRFVDRRTSVLMRRLKENRMLEAQVNATGDVIVEGQPIGRLEGFRFTADPGAEGAEAKALRAAATNALGSEIELRATRLSASGDEHLTLSLDGVIRYLGEPIAVLATGAKLTDPRFVLLADDVLAGVHREMVETRLTLWLKAHVAKLLGPLLALEASESLTGMARGIAFQVIEGLGILDRAGVANDVRTLDQNARSELRKLGLRFGAHHLFLPALMKPGPRSLAAQLHVLTHGGDSTALRDVSHLAFSGRTSIPVDAAIDPALYRVAGFRTAGPRALRVDILERLADLIRPAMTYRPGVSDGVPPAGTADGDGFVVTGSMTSLVGCAGVEFGEVLKALGYRSETRTGPAITVALKAMAPMTPVVVTVALDAAAEAETQAQVEDQAEPVADENLAETTDETVAVESVASDAGTEKEAQPEAEVSSGTAEQELPVSEELSAQESAPKESSAEASVLEGDAADAVVAEVPTIEVWRVARAERPRGDQQRRRHAGGGGRQGEAGAGAPAAREGHRDRRPDRRPKPEGEGAPTQQDKPRHERPGQNQGARTDKRERFERFGGKPGGKPGDKSRFDRKGAHEPAQRQNFERKPPVEKPLDPDSPFAALMALKAKMEGKS